MTTLQLNSLNDLSNPIIRNTALTYYCSEAANLMQTLATNERIGYKMMELATAGKYQANYPWLLWRLCYLLHYIESTQTTENSATIANQRKYLGLFVLYLQSQQKIALHDCHYDGKSAEQLIIAAAQQSLQHTSTSRLPYLYSYLVPTLIQPSRWLTLGAAMIAGLKVGAVVGSALGLATTILTGNTLLSVMICNALIGSLWTQQTFQNIQFSQQAELESAKAQLNSDYSAQEIVTEIGSRPMRNANLLKLSLSLMAQHCKHSINQCRSWVALNEKSHVIVAHARR